VFPPGLGGRDVHLVEVGFVLDPLRDFVDLLFKDAAWGTRGRRKENRHGSRGVENLGREVGVGEGRDLLRLL